MIFRTDINFKKRWKSVLKVPILFEVIPNESIFVDAADQFFIAEAAGPAANLDAKSSTFFEQLYHRMIISTMGRQEVRVMSTGEQMRSLYYLVLLARRAGSLYSSVYKKNDEDITKL